MFHSRADRRDRARGKKNSFSLFSSSRVVDAFQHATRVAVLGEWLVFHLIAHCIPSHHRALIKIYEIFFVSADAELNVPRIAIDFVSKADMIMQRERPLKMELIQPRPHSYFIILSTIFT
jgi:hypothetical protein